MKNVFGYVMLLVVLSVVIFPLMIFKPFYTAALSFIGWLYRGFPITLFLLVCPLKVQRVQLRISLVYFNY